MIQNVNLECIKIIDDSLNYLPTIYIFVGMAHFFSIKSKRQKQVVCYAVCEATNFSQISII
jgi:hypothetical protein